MDNNNIYKQIRLLLGLSQSELSEISGVSQGMISQYESGNRKPKIDTIKQLFDQAIIKAQADPAIYTIDRADDIDRATLLYFSLIPRTEESGIMRLSTFEAALIEILRGLNNTGKQKAIDFIMDLKKISDYRK